MTRLLMKSALLVLFASLVFLTGCGSGDDDLDESAAVEVPDVVELSRREARTALADVGLRYRYKGGGDFVFSGPPNPGGFSTADDDIVVDQDPDGGERIERGDIVTLDVSCEIPSHPLKPGEACD